MAKEKTVSGSAPQVIHDLVARFADQHEVYRRGNYNEAMLRQDFLDPFFAAMGWDVDNRKGYAEAFREVVHEDSLQVEMSARAPDYCFRIGGTRKFFVEAKKPAVDIKTDVGPAFQLRRYAWTAKLPLSILTDFEELAVYDCRIKPDKIDKASVARVMLLNYTEFAERWDELVGIFSPEAIQKGSFDKYAESNKKKRGTAEVDEAFLEEIEEWRASLAKNLSLRNKTLTDRELNFSVQRIIDRIIFLRMCEGRGIEPFGRLQALLNGTKVYARLVELFQRADEKYNSGLFHFHKEKGREQPDTLTTGLDVDDKILKDIFRRLYYPESPYEFAAMPAEILGQVYEQFLGKVIRLTKGHQAKIEEKPEVRKAGGVYYTPSYIVDYIVANTVGKLLEGKTAQEVGGLTKTWQRSKTAKPLSVLDPACGSGSFLIVAYQYLLNWYLKQYTEVDKPAQHEKGKSPRIYRSAQGDWRLTTAERKRILLSHIYGVDIDYQACEVTKLSLLLKVLEGETEETLQRQLFQKERALPDLANNIKCGNSLIGPDFYQGRQRDLFDEEEMLRINAFDWQAEFKEIFSGKNPGFDAVIGNPPYVRQESIVESKDYFATRYQTFHGVADLYTYFIERGRHFLNDGGIFGMIVSNKWLRSGYGQPLREFLVTKVALNIVVDLAGLPIFEGATVRPVILFYCLGKPAKKLGYVPPPNMAEFKLIRAGLGLSAHVGGSEREVFAESLMATGWTFSDRRVSQLIARLKSLSIPLESYVGRKPYFGVKTGLNKVFIIDASQRDELLAEDPTSAEIIKPVIGGRDIDRYSLSYSGKYLLLCRRGIEIERYPAVLNYLLQFRDVLTPKKKRTDPIGRKPGAYRWYELQDAVDYFACFDAPKLIFPDIATECRFAYDTHGYYGTNTTYIIPGDDLYLLAILNSRLAFAYFSETCAGLEGGSEVYLRFFGDYLEHFPVFVNSSQQHSRANLKERLVSLVQLILELKTNLTKAKTYHDRTALERQIAATDREIDQLVYQLYGLTDKEIAIVEEATRK